MAKKAKDRVEKVWLACEECGARNYMVKRRRGLKLSIKKYCPTTRKHTLHTEKRK